MKSLEKPEANLELLKREELLQQADRVARAGYRKLAHACDRCNPPKVFKRAEQLRRHVIDHHRLDKGDTTDREGNGRRRSYIDSEDSRTPSFKVTSPLEIDTFPANEILFGQGLVPEYISQLNAATAGTLPASISRYNNLETMFDEPIEDFRYRNYAGAPSGGNVVSEGAGSHFGSTPLIAGDFPGYSIASNFLPEGKFPVLPKPIADWDYPTERSSSQLLQRHLRTTRPWEDRTGRDRPNMQPHELGKDTAYDLKEQEATWPSRTADIINNVEFLDDSSESVEDTQKVVTAGEVLGVHENLRKQTNDVLPTAELDQENNNKSYMLNSKIKESNDNRPFTESVPLEPYNIVERLTPSHLVPKIGISDAIKETFELWLSHPVIWWPLKQRNFTCPKNYSRLSWNCADGTEIYVDLPTAEATAMWTDRIDTAHPASNDPILPVHSPISSSATSPIPRFSQSAENVLGITQRSASKSQDETSSISSQTSVLYRHRMGLNQQTKGFIHWCCDVSKFETKLFHIPVPGTNNVTFIDELRAKYNSAAGFRRWFTLTACYGVKFVMFERVHKSRDIVACGREDLPSSKTNPEYVYTYTDPREQFVKTLERSLMHHFHNPRGCSAQDISDILERIPKRIDSKLEEKYGAVGYGMYAVPGWAVWKLLLALLLSQIGPMIFVIRWMSGHPDDLNNAFTLAMYLIGLLNLGVVVPDIWTMQK